MDRVERVEKLVIEPEQTGNRSTLEELEPRVCFDPGTWDPVGGRPVNPNVVEAAVFPIRGDPDACLGSVRAAKLEVLRCQRLVDTDMNLLADSQRALAVAKNTLATAVHKLLTSLNVE